MVFGGEGHGEFMAWAEEDGGGFDTGDDTEGRMGGKRKEKEDGGE